MKFIIEDKHLVKWMSLKLCSSMLTHDAFLIEDSLDGLKTLIKKSLRDFYRASAY